MVSATSKVLKALLSGKVLTPAQISKKFGLDNPHNPVYQLSERGYYIVRQYKKTKQGYYTVKYSMPHATA
jgi:hypothetical protein